MEIKRLSQFGFQITVVQKAVPVTLIIDPFDLGSRRKLEADILLLTEKREKIASIKGSPFLITGPGEYEIKGVFVQGIAGVGLKKQRIVIYAIQGEENRICYLRNLGQAELNSQQLDALGNVDVLLFNAGADFQNASSIISQIEPKLVVPINDPKSQKTSDGLKKFLKTMSAKSVEETKKLKIKNKELSAQEKTKIVILKS